VSTGAKRGAVEVPLQRAGLVAAQLGHLAGRLGALDGRAASVVLETALAERKHAQGAKLALVWTGPEGEEWLRAAHGGLRHVGGMTRVGRA